ncbi:MAG: fused MFS/spermidine synthase [Saprospiraceae bacterium]|nr:fused MFS/spermidine synthase [Saprospiraceae bacterium]MCB0590390.1 fused MFS/spermidine synthase [Saprospiraceae bacterium]MCO5284604.1 fused MFS/spermidine synthase [Saprospiraceae bacterium]MCO6471404.1 fused MFS/spermidine synthase [Saprospiraceae bacterium]HMY84108.1 fused MFS/spermidine synthase [Saprospiraceae bacterium]
MKLPVNTWTKLLSYLVKVPVSRSESINDGALYVDLVKGRLQLSTDHAVYSFDDKYDNFVKALKAVKADLFRNKSILVLGGGLGSIPYILEKNHQFQGELTMVENDPAVIRLFLEYSLPRMNTLIDIRESDAIIFMEQNSRKYDMIIVDLFIDDTVPDQFLEADFLMLCKVNLVKGGLVLFNWMTVTKAQTQNYKDYRDMIFNEIMDHPLEVKTKYNHILVGYSFPTISGS